MNDNKDDPPLGYFEDFCEFFMTILLPWTIGFLCGIVFLIVFLLGFTPIGN